jgi:hypothetical protein
MVIAGPDGKPEVLVAGDGSKLLRPVSWSPDGSTLLYEQEDPARNVTTIHAFDMTKREEPASSRKRPSASPRRGSPPTADGSRSTI